MGVASGQSDGSSGSEGGASSGSSQTNVEDLVRDYQQRFDQQGGELQRSQREIAALRDTSARTSKTLDGLRKVLGGEDDKPVDDGKTENIRQWEGEIEEYLKVAIEAERRGKPIPVTINSAIRSLEGLIQKEREVIELRQKMGDLEKKVQRVSDPGVRTDEAAFTQMDGFIMNSLNTVFGAGDEYADQKRAQFRAIGQLVSEEIKHLQKDEPDVWDRIRRNPTDQRKMINHFVEQSIPPRARQMMEDDHIRRTPLTMRDLNQAWNEAKQIEDPRERSEVKAKLRPYILEEIAMKGRKRNQSQDDRPTMSSLFG